MKRFIPLLLVAGLAFLAGGTAVFFYLKHNLASYEKQTTALARWQDSDRALKEAELLISLHNRYSGGDEKIRDATCFLVTSKVEQMVQDLEVIKQGLDDPSRKYDVKFQSASAFFEGSAKRRLEVLLESSGKLGCK